MTAPRIGIVGSGIAGCSLAYRVTARFGADAHVVVFEREPRLGGRIRRVTVGGRETNAGGKYVHSSNRELLALVDALGLSVTRPEAPGEGPSGIWDGEQFVVRTDGGRWRPAAALLRRYGASLARLHALTARFLRRFRRVYRPAVATAAFETPTALLAALGLDHLLRVPGDVYLRENGVSDRAVAEYVSALTRNFYAQNAADVHAFACLVALVGGGTVGSVATVAGGTRRVCEELLAQSTATLRTGVEIRAVRVADDRVAVETAAGTEWFDAVCLAAPLATAGVELDPALSHDPATEAPFVRLATTYVTGRLDPATFGGDGTPPRSVLTTATADVPFYDLHRVPTDAETAPTFALASRESAVAVEESALFESVADVRTLRWQAYPEFDPAVPVPPFRLNPRVYYVNAMEPVVSAMETQVVASRTVWNLLAETEPWATPS